MKQVGLNVSTCRTMNHVQHGNVLPWQSCQKRLVPERQRRYGAPGTAQHTPAQHRTPKAVAQRHRTRRGKRASRRGTWTAGLCVG